MNLFILSNIKNNILYDKLCYKQKINDLSLPIIFYSCDYYSFLFNKFAHTSTCKNKICNIKCYKCNCYSNYNLLNISINNFTTLQQFIKIIENLNNDINIVIIKEENKNIINEFLKLKKRNKFLYIIQTYNKIDNRNMHYYKPSYIKNANSNSKKFYHDLIVLFYILIKKKCTSLEMTLILIKFFKNNIIHNLYKALSNILLIIYNNNYYYNLYYKNLYDIIFLYKKHKNVINMLKYIIKIKKLYYKDYIFDNLLYIEKIISFIMI
ncbi:MAG: hypothetical protein HYZ30_00595 [Candidatus Azosocius agrarius]|nr:MAG: hypothetical protein HYZ30_00595 [Gammaproteobacteria bacterium]